MKHIKYEEMELCGIITQGPWAQGDWRDFAHITNSWHTVLHGQGPSSLYLPTGKAYPVKGDLERKGSQYRNANLY